MKQRIATLAWVAGCAIALAGCFYPPSAEQLDESKVSTIIPLPYDLAWDAVNSVIRENGFKVQAQNPNHGIIEVLGKGFSLQDADCGMIGSVAGSYAAPPELDSSAVYNFSVKPHGNEASTVEVLATFESPLKVPLRPVKDLECVSRGVQEERLLKQILAQAKRTHPPVYKRPGREASASSQAPKPLRPSANGPATLLRSEVIHPDVNPNEPHLR